MLNTRQATVLLGYAVSGDRVMRWKRARCTPSPACSLLTGMKRPPVQPAAVCSHCRAHCCLIRTSLWQAGWLSASQYSDLVSVPQRMLTVGVDRNGKLALGTSKHTQWHSAPAASIDRLESIMRPRSFLQACDVTKLVEGSTFDYAGVVVGITPPMSGMLKSGLE